MSGCGVKVVANEYGCIALKIVYNGVLVFLGTKIPSRVGVFQARLDDWFLEIEQAWNFLLMKSSILFALDANIIAEVFIPFKVVLDDDS